MKDPLGQLRLRFAGLRLVREHRHGQVYAGKDFSGNDVAVAVLNEPAAADPNLRRSFAEAVEANQRGSGSAGPAVNTSDVRAALPWAAIRDAGGAELAQRLIASVGGASAPASASPPPASLDALPPLPDALSLADKPAPVFPDPTFAAPPLPPVAPAPSELPPPGASPAAPPVMPAPPPVRPATASPTRMPPGQRSMPPGQRPMPPGQAPMRPGHRYQVPAAVPPRPPMRRQSSSTPVSAAVAAMIVGVLLLMICLAAIGNSL